MKEIPPVLNSDISAIQSPEKRTLVRWLTIAVLGLSGFIGVLFAIILSREKSSKSEDRQRIVQLEGELSEERRQRSIKDSMLTASLVREAQKNNEDIFKEKMQIQEKLVTLKTQDSLLKLIKVNR